MRKITVAAALLLILFFLSGCSQTGIDERGIVQGIIIDNTNADKQQFSFAMLEADGNSDNEISPVSAADIETAQQLLERSTGKPIFWGQCEYIVISYTDAQKAYDTLEFFINSNKIPPDITLVFADKNAIKILGKQKQTPQFITSAAEKISSINKTACTKLMHFVTAYIDGIQNIPVCMLKGENEKLSTFSAVLLKK